jgi:hypothetical protein
MPHHGSLVVGAVIDSLPRLREVWKVMIITVMQRAEPEGYSYGEGTGKRLPMAKVGGRGGSRRLALWEGFGHARLIKKAKPLLTII